MDFKMRFADRIVSLLMTATVFAAVSCVRDNPKADTVKAKTYNYFSAVASYDGLSAEGGTIRLDVNSNVSWKIATDKALVPAVKEGYGKVSVDIAVPENTSFLERRYAFSVSTEEELDVDDPQQWTEFGRTIDFECIQPGITAKFYVDKSNVKVSALETSATVILTENVGFDLVCETAGMSCKVTDDPQSEFRHFLEFSFPANTEETPVTYYATITPKDQSLPEITPVTVAVTQSAYKLFVLDCSNADNFRYNNKGSKEQLPARASSRVYCDGEFWLDGKEDYKFEGKVYRWSKTLATDDKASGLQVKLPQVDGYVLSGVDVTYSYATSNRTYSIVDADGESYGSCTRTRSTTDPTAISLSVSEVSGKVLYLKSDSEMCLQFSLTYVSVE